MNNVIKIYDHFGSMCANGDKAVIFLKKKIIPAIESNDKIIFDFSNVRNMNSSFSNALFANLIINNGVSVLDKIKFLNCNERIKSMVNAAIQFGNLKKT